MYGSEAPNATLWKQRFLAHAKAVRAAIPKRQLLVLDTSTGGVLAKSTLPGLPSALGASPIEPFVAMWGVAFMEKQRVVEAA